MSKDSLEDIRAVLFDLDETLIDAPRGLKAAHEALAKKFCEYFSCEDSGNTEKEISEQLDDFDDHMNFERKYDRDSWWPEFVRQIDLEGELNRSQIKELTEIYWDTYAKAAKPYPSADSVLNYLSEKGYAIGVVTDTDGSGIPKRDRITDLAFSSMLDVIVVGGEDTEEPKPDSSPFEIAMSELGLGAEECVMVGDKPFTDIKGANSVGMKTILVNRRDWGVEEKPDFEINSLDEIKEFL